MKRRALLLKNSTKASDPAVVSHQGRDKVPLGTTGGLVPRLQADRSPTALEDVGRTPPWEPRVGAVSHLVDDRGSYLQTREGRGSL